MKKNTTPDKYVSKISNLDNPINKIVVSRGSPLAKLMIVGEAPGAKEEALGQPFVGRSGKLLDQLLQNVGIDISLDVYFCNVVKCRPPQNRRPTKKEIQESWAVTAGIAGTIIGGLIADRFGARRIASLFAVLTGLSIFTIALAEDLWQNRTVMTWLIVIYPFFGAAMGISLISLFMNVTWPKVGATQFTLYMALLNFGALFGLKMAGYFEENFTYTTTIMIGGSCQLLIAFVLPFIDPGQTRRELGNEF